MVLYIFDDVTASGRPSSFSFGFVLLWTVDNLVRLVLIASRL